MKIKFEHADKSVSTVLSELAKTIKPEGVSLKDLLESLGERGLLLFSMILTVPFLLGVSIPGAGVPFGIVIALIGVGITTNKAPWLPERLMNRRISAENLILTLERGAKLFARLERLTHPRLLLLTHGMTMARLNGMLIIIGAILLIYPLPLPFTNAPPSYGILFLTLGSMERDGYLVIAGYLTLLLTTVTFALITILGVDGVKALLPFLSRHI